MLLVYSINIVTNEACVTSNLLGGFFIFGINIESELLR